MVGFDELGSIVRRPAFSCHILTPNGLAGFVGRIETNGPSARHDVDGWRRAFQGQDVCPREFLGQVGGGGCDALLPATTCATRLVCQPCQNPLADFEWLSAHRFLPVGGSIALPNSQPTDTLRQRAIAAAS